MGAVGLFAIFHGHAHGTEMPLDVAGPYGVGFLLATAVLHALGIFIGFLMGMSSKPWVTTSIALSALLLPLSA
jgi:urease accessory protein